MTLQDEIRDKIITTYQGVFQSNPEDGYTIADGTAKDILAIIQPRFDEIRRLSGIRIPRTDFLKDNSYYTGVIKEIYEMVDRQDGILDEILTLCTIDEPEPDKPEIIMGQRWRHKSNGCCKTILRVRDETRYGKDEVPALSDQGKVHKRHPATAPTLCFIDKKTFYESHELIEDSPYEFPYPTTPDEPEPGEKSELFSQLKHLADIIRSNSDNPSCMDKCADTIMKLITEQS